MSAAADLREWLEADGLGGFAMGTACGIRTRRYHACLTTATTPPTGRVVLVSGFEAWVEGPGGPQFLTSQHYAPGVIHPDGHRRLLGFDPSPWPTWTHRLDDGAVVTTELCCEPLSGEVALCFHLRGGGQRPLLVRPLLAVRDYHALQREDPAFRFEPAVAGGNVAWQPYAGRPGVTVLSNGRYRHEPTWYRQFCYQAERERGLDSREDLASPGTLRFELGEGQGAAMILRAGAAPYGDAAVLAARLRERERGRRGAFPDALARAAAAYLVRRGDGLSVIAGYPWFTDWGRDTFIATRGLCLATGRLDEARQILLAWTDAVSEGMLPNRFTEGGADPEYNSVDASLWYVVIIGELLAAAPMPERDRRRLLDAALAILRGYAAGARFRIGADGDGLLAAGVPGVQLTWMDAKVGDRVITPRIGKPVEIQALWINALAVGEQVDPELGRLRERATASFLRRFLRADGSLHDVVDAGHVPGAVDASFRPNQIFAAGGLPIPLLTGAAARRLVDLVEERLWTPLGLRSLDPADPAYRGRYEGGVIERDEAYHQGSVWTWLAGPFIEAWLRSRGGSAGARREARRRLLAPLLGALERQAGLGHLAELADGEAPHAPRGAPFQAWSLAELLRIRRQLGADDE